MNFQALGIEKRRVQRNETLNEQKLDALILGAKVFGECHRQDSLFPFDDRQKTQKGFFLSKTAPWKTNKVVLRNILRHFNGQAVLN